VVAAIGTASAVPANPINTAGLHDSNGFQLGRDANPQRFRYNAANFNKFLVEPDVVLTVAGLGV